MSKIGKIKIVKKGAALKSQVVAKKEVRSKRKAAREMVTTVTSWVNEFQQRKRTETKTAFEQLFPKQPAPTES